MLPGPGQESRSSSFADFVAAFLILISVVLIIGSAAQRHYVNAGTETDFIGGFQPEAARFLAGESLDMSFHPPGYPIALAAVYALLDDWFIAGLALSATSALLVLITSYWCFRELIGPRAGLGALAALMGSTVFFSFSIQSTSDVYFLALWYSTMCLVVVAMRQNLAWQWLAAGLLISITALSRTNGFVCMMLMVAPLVSAPTRRKRIASFSAVFAGAMVPLLLWFSYSFRTGSPFMPTKTYLNLALTYFSEGGRIMGDPMESLQSQFTSTWDVLTRDPVRVLRTYLVDMLYLPARLVLRMTWLPLALLCVLCAPAWLTKFRDVRSVMVLLVTIASIALINMKAFEARFYLMLLPVAGASMSLAVDWLSRRTAASHWTATRGTVAVAVLAFLALGISGKSGFSLAEDPVLSSEFAEIISQIEEKTPSDAQIICRKCVAVFHSRRSNIKFPVISGLDELCTYVQSLQSSLPTYIVIASWERKLRPELSRALLESPLPEWLELTAEGSGDTPWRLIRYKSDVQCR